MVNFSISANRDWGCHVPTNCTFRKTDRFQYTWSVCEHSFTVPFRTKRALLNQPPKGSANCGCCVCSVEYKRHRLQHFSLLCLLLFVTYLNGKHSELSNNYPGVFQETIAISLTDNLRVTASRMLPLNKFHDFNSHTRYLRIKSSCEQVSNIQMYVVNEQFHWQWIHSTDCWLTEYGNLSPITDTHQNGHNLRRI